MYRELLDTPLPIAIGTALEVTKVYGFLHTICGKANKGEMIVIASAAKQSQTYIKHTAG